MNDSKRTQADGPPPVPWASIAIPDDIRRTIRRDLEAECHEVTQGPGPDHGCLLVEHVSLDELAGIVELARSSRIIITVAPSEDDTTGTYSMMLAWNPWGAPWRA